MSSWHELPVSDQVRRRPVYDRLLRRRHHMPLDPPNEAERRDAILVLRDPWEDDIAEEALRILDEAGR
jgi:hypothetical protein